MIILFLNVPEFLLPFQLTADTYLHAELVKRFLFGDIHYVEANLVHFPTSFNPEKEPLVVPIRI